MNTHDITWEEIKSQIDEKIESTEVLESEEEALEESLWYCAKFDESSTDLEKELCQCYQCMELEAETYCAKLSDFSKDQDKEYCICYLCTGTTYLYDVEP